MSIRPLYCGTIVLLLAACGKGEDAAPVPDALPPSDMVVLDSAQAAAAGLSLAAVGRLPADTLALTGIITFNPSLVSHVGPRMQGRIRHVGVDVGSPVKAGDSLAVLDSPELGAMQTSWSKARVTRDVAARNFERAERLFQDGVVSQRRRLEAEAEVREREADLAAATQALVASGAEADTAATGLFVMRAPLRGAVVERHATVGEVVGPESDLFTVGDLSRLWLLLDLYEADLSRVNVGMSAHISAQAYPEKAFSGRVAYIGAEVDSVSRTVKVRLEIPNPSRLLKPGMFVRASLVLVDAEPRVGLPRDAIQSVGGKDVVFVPTGNGRFRLCTVQLGKQRAGGWVEILSGLQPGDTAVTGGSFALKAHLERASAGAE
ncbi:MAG: efflux RND transporter periplasmic adaptor subunit [Gemmatimonadetes bacterium]|nr:efflux RND transporter periplasmic adaptor subunit [Gemmatimonadota bacterium]